MTEIRTPAFDPTDKTWFIEEDHGTTAKSIAELQRKLPGVKLAGYNPEGYGLIVRPRPREIVKITLNQARGEGKVPPKLKELQTLKPPEALPEPEIKEEIVELPVFIPAVKRQVPEPEIERVPEPTPKPNRPRVVKKKVKLPRSLPQASQVPRTDWTAINTKNKLLALVESGLTSGQIAIEFGCTRNAVIGACGRFGFQLKGKGRFRS